MLSAQEIYGPHEGDTWSGGDVALGRRLMRVLPEDRYDRQPLLGANGRYVLVADLRLDNRDELARELRIPAGRMTHMCDAAVLLAAIEKWEDGCIDRLVGDYAFAVWDVARRRLLLARDPLGQRPLHYHIGDKFFAVASMPKGLHSLPDVPYIADEEQIAEYLATLPLAGTRTFYREIERVQPGHIVEITTPGRLTARRYWRPARRTIQLGRADDYCDALRELLDQAVRCRLRGTDHVAAHLSGGLDSSAVAATAARLLAPSGGKVTAFTSVPREGYNGPAPRNRIVDEGPYAAMTAALYPNMEHILVRCPDRRPLDDLDRSFFLCETADSVMRNTAWIFSINDAARERGLKVLLTGMTGNVGLSYDGMAWLPTLFRQGRWLRWLREASAIVACRRMRWRGVVAASVGPLVPAPLWIWLNRVIGGVEVDASRFSVLNSQRLIELDVARLARERGFDLATRPDNDGFAERMRILERGDFGNYAKGVLAGWQIDMRDPTADTRLLEFCLQVPMEQYLHAGVPRALGRRTLADRLPRTVVEEQLRGLQSADWHETLTAERGHISVELDRIENCLIAIRMLDLPRLKKLVDNWPAEGWERSDIAIPYSIELLSAVSVGHFLRRVSGANG